MNAIYTEQAFERVSNRPRSSTVLERTFADHRACCREILRLTNENARIADELARARDNCEDLTKSAELWIRLYEAQLARNRRISEATPASPEGPRS